MLIVHAYLNYVGTLLSEQYCKVRVMLQNIQIICPIRIYKFSHIFFYKMYEFLMSHEQYIVLCLIQAAFGKSSSPYNKIIRSNSNIASKSPATYYHVCAQYNSFMSVCLFCCVFIIRTQLLCNDSIWHAQSCH